MFHRPLLFALAFLLCPAAGQAATCDREFTFNPRPVLGLTDVKRLATPDASIRGSDLSTADGAQLVVWPFDEEDHPTRGRWRAIALVYVTRGDLGEKTVGGELLQLESKPPLSLSRAEIKKTANGLQLTLPVDSGCPPFVIRLDDRGGLTAQGRLLGRLPP